MTIIGRSRILSLSAIASSLFEIDSMLKINTYGAVIWAHIPTVISQQNPSVTQSLRNLEPQHHHLTWFSPSHLVKPPSLTREDPDPRPLSNTQVTEPKHEPENVSLSTVSTDDSIYEHRAEELYRWLGVGVPYGQKGLGVDEA